MFTLTIQYFPNQADTNSVNRMIFVSRRVALCVVLILYSHEFLVLLLGNCVIAHSLYPNSVGRLKYYHRSNEMDTSSKCWIITHVICIHCARVNLTFGVFLPKSGIHTVNACWLHVPDIKFIDLLVFFNYVVTNSWSRYHATGITSAIILCITNWGLVFMLTPKYEVSRTTQYWVITLFIWIRYMT